MNALTVTLGTIGVAFSLLAWASFVGGVAKMVRAIRIGQSAPDRWRPFLPRLKTMLIEFIAHTRMNKFRTVGWAHWLVMVGFLAGFILYFEAYGQVWNPEFHWPIFGNWHIYCASSTIRGCPSGCRGSRARGSARRTSSRPSFSSRAWAWCW